MSQMKRNIMDKFPIIYCRLIIPNYLLFIQGSLFILVVFLDTSGESYGKQWGTNFIHAMGLSWTVLNLTTEISFQKMGKAHFPQDVVFGSQYYPHPTMRI